VVTINKIQHREAPRIGIYFGYDDQLKQGAKRIGARWSQSKRCWYVDYNTENFHKIKLTFPEIEIVKDTDQNVPQPAPGLQKSHDIAPIVAATNDNALPLPVAPEHNPPPAGEKVGNHDDNFGWNSIFTKMVQAKSDKFMWIFASWQQVK